MSPQKAREIMGEHYMGPQQLSGLSWLRNNVEDAPDVTFSEQALKQNTSTHILFFAPSKPKLTINWFREQFGMNPKTHEPCMYNQDWYLDEQFAAKESLDGAWHLIRKDVLEEARGARPDEVEKTLSKEQFPTAVTLTFLFFAWQELKGEILWKHDFLWCKDRDHNGDRIYVGRYEDPAGVNKNGFNIHRHLALRSAYSVAPEVSL